MDARAVSSVGVVIGQSRRVLVDDGRRRSRSEWTYIFFFDPVDFYAVQGIFPPVVCVRQQEQIHVSEEGYEEAGT